MVYFVGRASEGIEHLVGAVARSGIPCATSDWADLPATQAELCVFLEAPENDAERAVLSALVRRRVPLFAVEDDPVWSLYGRHAVCTLPCELDAEALARFLPWFDRRPGASHVDLAEKNRKMTHELRLASELQRSILPRGIPAGCPVNLARKYVPYQYIGGDFYDFLSLDGGRLGLVIADACGHGISAAFLTAMFKSTFRLYAQDGSTPAQALGRLNTELSRTLMTDHFMSAFYAILDTSTGVLSYCSAGHPPQILFRASGSVVELSSMGFLLGSVEEADYVDDVLTLGPGDRLLLYTDGIVEATDGTGAQFGRRRVVDAVRRNFAKSIEQISNELLSEAVMFLQDPTFQDDVTLIIAEMAEEI